MAVSMHTRAHNFRCAVPQRGSVNCVAMKKPNHYDVDDEVGDDTNHDGADDGGDDGDDDDGDNDDDDDHDDDRI